MKRFAAGVLVAVLIMIAAVKIGAAQSWFEEPSFSLLIVIFLALLTIASYAFVAKRIHGESTSFVNAYIGSIVVRLLVFTTFVGILMWIEPESLMENCIFFLLNYFVLTSWEVVSLFLRVNSPRGQ